MVLGLSGKVQPQEPQIEETQEQNANFRRMTVNGCIAYAQDGQRFAILRDAKISQEDTLRVFAGLRAGWYTDVVWPYVADLILLTYESTVAPEEWSIARYQECVKLGGGKRLTSS